jgi:hypothetical protein
MDANSLLQLGGRAMIRAFVVVSLVLCALALPDDAEAGGYAYVCTVQYNPAPAVNNPPSFGNDGYVYVTYNSKPHCKGEDVYFARYCTPGETAINCDDDYRYPLPALLSLKESLHKAVVDGTLVFVAIDEQSSSLGAGQFVTFFGE